MAEQPQEVGSAMWGGRTWPEKVEETEQQPTAQRIPDGLISSLLSVALLVLGACTMAVGAGLLWGLGAGLFTIGGLAVIVAILLGVTS